MACVKKARFHLRGCRRLATKALFSSPVSADPKPPPSIPDHDLMCLIGSGSYGDVWLARNIMDAWRAVKIVYKDRFRNERPYEREFEGLQRYEPVSRTHDSQVDILHVGRNERAGFFYCVMELADDLELVQDIQPDKYRPKTLRSMLEWRGRISPSECVDIGIALSTALEHLHKHNLVHRDVKPANIIFIHGQPKLADVGLVTHATEMSSMVGTIGFVAPEGPGSIRADIFSLGRVLYEMYTGLSGAQFPNLPSTMMLDERDNVILRELNLITLKACDHDHGKRHASVAELRAELILLQTGHSVRKLRKAEQRAVFFQRLGLVALAGAIITGIAYLAAARSMNEALQARKELRRQLVISRLSEARALEVSDTPGRRFQALEAIREAARVQDAASMEFSRELRDAAVAALTMMDLGEPDKFMPHPAESLSKSQGDSFRTQFSPDLRYAAWVTEDESILIGHSFHQDEVQRIPPAPDDKALKSIRWSPGGEYIAAHYTGELRIWDVREKRTLLVVPLKDSVLPGNPASFSGDGKVVGMPVDGELALFELPSGNLIRRSHPFDIHGVCLNPRQPWVAVKTNSGARLWNYQTGTTVRDVSAINVNAMDWSADGRLLALALRDLRIIVFDTVSGNAVTLSGHPDRVVHLTFSSSGDLLASFTREGTTKLWNPLSGELLASTDRGLGLGFSADAQRLAFWRPNGLGIWPLTAGRNVCQTMVGRIGYDLVEHIAFCPTGRWIMSMSEGPDGIWVWDVEGRKLVHDGQRDSVPRREWLAVAPDGEKLYTLGRYDGLVVWPLVKDPEHPQAAPRIGPARKIPLPEGSSPNDVAWLRADGKKLAFQQRRGQLVIYDLENLDAPPLAFNPETGVGSVALSPDGKHMAVGSRLGGGSFVIDIESLQRIQKLSQLDARVAYSNDGRWLVAHTTTGCDLFNARTFVREATYPRDLAEREPGEIVFSNDSQTLAFFKDRRTVELVDLRTLRPLVSLRVPAGATARSLRFSPDNTLLAVHDKVRLHLYDLPALRRELAALGLDW